MAYEKRIIGDGNIFEGEFVADELHGKGKITLKNGASSDGNFVNGVLQGKGKGISSEGVIYEGDYLNGTPHGKGKLTSPAGDFYEGDFEDNLPHGKGKLTCPDGTVKEGVWRKGEYVQTPYDEVICETCGTVNYIENGDTSYTRCDKCRAKFKNARPEPPMDGGFDEWA